MLVYLGSEMPTAVEDGCRGTPVGVRSWSPSSSMTYWHPLPATTAHASNERTILAWMRVRGMNNHHLHGGGGG
jgi:hypothetical protein